MLPAIGQGAIALQCRFDDKKILDEVNIKITRLARGLPVGGNLEYVDEATLTKSMHGRVEVDSI